MFDANVVYDMKCFKRKMNLNIKMGNRANTLFAADWGEVIAYPKPPHLVQGDV